MSAQPTSMRTLRKRCCVPEVESGSQRKAEKALVLSEEAKMKVKASLLVIALVAAAALLAVGCDRLMTQSSTGSPEGIDPLAADPGDTSMVTIWAGQHYDAG